MYKAKEGRAVILTIPTHVTHDENGQKQPLKLTYRLETSCVIILSERILEVVTGSVNSQDVPRM